MAGLLCYQTTLSPAYSHKFEEYYADALYLYRKNLNDHLEMGATDTLLTGVLLCSIGVRIVVSILSPRSIF
jgi:hypothetical protein